MVVSLVLLMREKVPEKNPRASGRQVGVSDVGLCREPLGHFVDVEIYCFLAVFLHPCATTSGCIIASVCHYIWLCYCIRVPLGSTSPPPLYFPLQSHTNQI